MFSHGVAALGGICLFFALPHRPSSKAQVDSAPASPGLGSQRTSPRDQDSFRTGKRDSPENLRRLIERSADIPLSASERLELLGSLLDEWNNTDPESLLPWLERQTWLSRTKWPSFAGLAARKPDLVYQHIVANGDSPLLMDLIEGNPVYALRLRNPDERPIYGLQMRYVFDAGARADPLSFFEHLEEVEDPEQRSRACQAVNYALEGRHLYAELGAMWKRNPETVDLEVLSRAPFGWQNSGAADLMPDLACPDNEPTNLFERLTFFRKLQATYLPAMEQQDWQEILNKQLGVSQESHEIDALAAVADGDRSPGNLEAAAKALTGDSSIPPEDILSIDDPVFLNFMVKARLTGHGEKLTAEERQKLIEAVSDDALREELRALPDLQREPEPLPPLFSE